MSLNFREFHQVGREQWLVQPNLPRRFFVRLFGTLGVHARIRNTHVINAIRQLKLPEHARILDAGCGHAYATFWLARCHPRYEFTALELDGKLVQEGEYIADWLGLKNIHFAQGSLLDIKERAAYDLIFSIDVIEHIVDDLQVLRLFRHALRSDGWLLLHLPRRHQEHRRILPFFRSHTVPDHVRDEYTAAEIKAKLSEAGFLIHSIRYGFSTWGEMAFELNYLFWKWNLLRIISALLFHPFSVWFAYMDTRQNYLDGNSLLVLARPRETEARIE